MDILSISKDENEATITFNSSELVSLCNLLYQATKGEDAKASYLRLYADLIIARDLSQYGHIDGFCLNNIIKCRERLVGGFDGQEIHQGEL